MLAFGLAAGRARLSLEKVAINWINDRIPDNAGAAVHDQPVIAGGPAAYFSTLPLVSLREALQANGIPTEISLSAGAYLCNQVFYILMHTIATKNLPTQAGFIHLPALPEQAAKSDKPLPSLSLSTLNRALDIMITQLE